MSEFRLSWTAFVLFVRYDPELNAKVEEFCRHYGTVMLPTRPAMPRHKGKIESGIKYGQENALKGRSFASLAAQNLFLSEWESGVADTRIHGTTRQQVGKVFSEAERAKLLPLPAGLFPVFEEAPRTVHRYRRDIPRYGSVENKPKNIPFHFEVVIPLLTVSHIHN